MIGRNFQRILLVSVMFFCLAACGYHFSGEGEGPKPGLRCIAIPVFENKTSEPNAGALFAGALREEFMRKGTMRVVPVDDAEAVFKGTIKSISVVPIAHFAVSVVSQRFTVENELFITLDILCEDKKTHKVLWHDPGFTFFKVYTVNNALNPDPISGFENREDALRFLSQEMSTRIHDRFLSNF
ncbi:conserved exported hypothetical protein [Syntrophobacter sp. SbD1]|nr:conserved exported hypothetical protein [Syntrophobacter sp. SbD1]